MASIRASAAPLLRSKGALASSIRAPGRVQEIYTAIPASSALLPLQSKSYTHAQDSSLFAQQRRFSSTKPANMAEKKSLIEAVQERRSHYKINKEIPISDDRIVDLAETAIKHVPSSFNSQSTRLVVLLKKDHDKFWDFTLEALRALVPADQFAHTEQRIAGFKAGYGTILFFEDPDPIHALQKQFAIYADKFPNWSEHTSALHQYFLWLALEAEGLGANLQHYNPVVDQKVQDEWKVPQEWSLKAQLVFGGRAGEAGEKTFKPIQGERLFVHGK